MGLKNFFRSAKDKLRTVDLTIMALSAGADHSQSRTETDSTILSEYATVEDPVLGPRLRVLASQHQDVISPDAHPSPLRRGIRKRLSQMQIAALFKKTRNKSKSRSRNLDATIPIPSISKLPANVRTNRNIPAEESHGHQGQECVTRADTQQKPTKDLPWRAAITAFNADLVLLGVHQLPGAVSERITQILHTMSIARKELTALKPVHPHMILTINLRLHALLRQQISEREVQQSVRLLVDRLEEWTLEIEATASSGLLDLLRRRVLAGSVFSRRKKSSRRSESLPLFRRHDLRSVPDEKVHLAALPEITYEDDQQQANQTFLENQNESLDSDIDADNPSRTVNEVAEMLTSPETPECVSTLSSEMNSEEPSDTSQTATSIVTADTSNTMVTPFDGSNPSTPSTSVFSESESFSEIAATYNTKEDVVRDYESVLKSRESDHDTEIEDLKDLHEDNIKNLKSAHEERVNQIRAEHERKLTETHRKAEEARNRTGETRRLHLEQKNECEELRAELEARESQVVDPQSSDACT